MIKLLITPSEKASSSFLNAVKNSSRKNTLCVLCSKSLLLIETKVKDACKGKTCSFIDTVSESKEQNVVYIPPANLTALSIAINQTQQSFKDKSTIIFDSISGLAVRNNPNTLIKFLLFLIKKSTDWGSDLILILPEKTMPEDFIATLSSSVDKVEKRK